MFYDMSDVREYVIVSAFTPVDLEKRVKQLRTNNPAFQPFGTVFTHIGALQQTMVTYGITSKGKKR